MVVARLRLKVWIGLFVCITGGSLQRTCLGSPSEKIPGNCSENAECCATDSAGTFEESHQTGSVAGLTPRVFCPFTCEEGVSCRNHHDVGTGLVVQVLRGSHGDGDHTLQPLQQTLEAGELRCGERQIRQQEQRIQEREKPECKESRYSKRTRCTCGWWFITAGVSGEDSLDHIDTEIEGGSSSRTRRWCSYCRSSRRSSEQSFDGAAGAVQTAASGSEESAWGSPGRDGEGIAGTDAGSSNASPDSQALEPIEQVREIGVFNTEEDCRNGRSMARVCCSCQREVQQAQGSLHAEKRADVQRFQREIGRAQQAESRDFNSFRGSATEASRREPRSGFVGNLSQHDEPTAIQGRANGDALSIPSRRGLGCGRRGDDSSQLDNGERWYQKEDGCTIFKRCHISYEGAATQFESKGTRSSQERTREVKGKSGNSGSQYLKGILKGHWLWEQPVDEIKNVKVTFDESVHVRVMHSDWLYDERYMTINDPDSLSLLDNKLDLDACDERESDEYSGMQFQKSDLVSSKVVQAIQDKWKERDVVSVRLWFIEHNGFGTAASVYKVISSEHQLASVWGYHCQLREVHLIQPNPSSPRHPADVHVLIAKNAFGAVDVLAEILVDGYREAKMTARVRGDTVRDVYVAAGYSRWLANPRLECMLFDGGTTLHLDDVIDLFQGAFVSLHVRSIPEDERDSESETSTTCPENSISSITDEDDGMSLLQHLADPIDNHTARHCWFDGSPCQFDRWCDSQNNSDLDSHNHRGPSQKQQQDKQWEWLREHSAEEIPDVFAWLDAPWQDDGGNEVEPDVRNDDEFEWVMVNGESNINVALQSAAIHSEESLLVVSFGIKDEDKGRRDGQLRDRTLLGLRRLLWELWQDEVEQFGVMQVFEASPQPLEELGLQQALVLVITLDGVQRRNEQLMQPTLNFVQYREEAQPRDPYTMLVPTPISEDDFLSMLREHDECDPFGVRACTILHAGERVLWTRPCHIVAGGVTKLLISSVPHGYHHVKEKIQGFDNFVRHVRQDSRRHGRRVTFVIHAVDQESVHVESFDLSLQPFAILSHPTLGRLVSQGTLHYLADSEVYTASGLPGWCYHFLHVASSMDDTTQVVTVLRFVNERGVITQPQWKVVRFPRECPINALHEHLRVSFALSQEVTFQVMHRYRVVRNSADVSSGDTVVVRIQQNAQDRSRSRSRNRRYEHDDTQSDDLSLLQFLDVKAGWQQKFPDSPHPRQTGKVVLSLENLLVDRPPRVTFELYDKLWPEQSDHFENDTEAEADIVSLRDVLRSLKNSRWLGLNTRFEDIPGLHPVAAAAVQWNGIGNLTPHLHIYTDGSAKQGKASWAFVVLNQIGEEYQCVGFSAGMLDDTIGPCEFSSTDAEATALIAMAEFVLSLGSFVKKVHCHFDALAVGHGASGRQAVVTKHDNIAERQEAARIMLSLLQSIVEVETHHVHAHVGNPFNECADSIATAVRKGWKCPKQAVLRSRELLQHPLRKWAWIEIAPTAMMPSLHDILHQQMQLRTETVPDPVLVVDTGNAEETYRATLRIATANVATMHYNKGSEGCMSDKANELAYQFQAAKYDVVAFQETRASVTGVRHLGCWLRVISASVKGHGGVEIWLNTESEFFRALSVKIDVQDVLVWHHDDRILALQVQWPGGSLNFVTVYAPQSGTAHDQIHKWWDEFDKVTRKKPSNSPVILLGDCNGRIGSVTSECIGDHAADIEDEAGTLFRQMCENYDWVVPSTHAVFHEGQTDTFIAPRGHRSRLDYIAVSASCSRGIDKSWVDPDIDLLNGDADHKVVALQISIAMRKKQLDCVKKISLYDRTAARVSTTQVDIPEVEWKVEVNQHWAQVRESVQRQCQRFYPKPKRVKRQIYFSQYTWEQLCYRKDLRQDLRKLVREDEGMMLRSIFQVWSRRVTSDQEKALEHRTRHLRRLQIALILHKQNQSERLFRQAKKNDWKEWAISRMRESVSAANVSKGSDLFRILQPKKAIQRSKFGAHAPLPGMQDRFGVWCQDRHQIALAWESQFGQLENAEKTDVTELWGRSQPKQRHRTVHDLMEIPDLFQFEEALRSMNPSKATGVDAIGAEVWKQDIASNARRLFPLLMKAALGEQWIVEFSGGWLLPLWKKKGSAQQMETYRGILLEPVLGRAISRAWRRQIVNSADGWTAMMQWGGRTGLSIEALHLHARLWQSNAAANRQCCALVFVDIKAAFYSVAKPLLAKAHHDEKQLHELFAKFKLPMTAFQAFSEAVENSDLVRRYTRSSVAAASVKATLSHSWYVVPNGSAVHAPETGSRPGDPLADLLFSMLMADILHEINRRQWEDPVFQGNVCDDLYISQNITWVDDSAFVVQSGAPQFVDQVTKLVHHIVDVMAERGVALSFGQGKTAVILTFQGKEAGKYKRKFEQERGQQLHVITEHFGLTKVPVVTHYKHLGGFLVRGGAVLPELRVRNAQTQAQIKPLRKILSNGELDLQKRRQLLQSMAIPVMCLHAGTWFDLNVGENEAWHAMVFRTYLALVARKGGDFPHHTIEELSVLADQPMPSAMLHVQKIRLFLQIVRAEDEQMIDAVLANGKLLGEKSWFAELQQAVEWIAQNRGDHDWSDYGLRDLHDRRAWRWASNRHADIKRWLKQAIKAHKIRTATFVKLKQFDQGQRDMLREWGWQHQPIMDVSHETAPEATCPDCGQVFKCKADVAVHQQRVHGRRIAVRRFVVDGVCRSCYRNFHSRARLIQHLHYGTTQCWVTHMRKYVPMTLEKAKEMDEKDCKAGAAHHQRGLHEYQRGQSWRPCTESEKKDVLQVKSHDLQGEVTAEEILQWMEIGLLPVAQGGRERSKRKQKGFVGNDVIGNCRTLERKIFQDADQWYGEPLIPRPLTANIRYVLLLFSGHRRYGDVASWLQWEGTIIPICIDVAIHRVYGDVHRDDLWIRLIKSGLVIGAHAGPPCETYSAARWIEEIGRLFPRPLRDGDHPWGIPNRSVKETKQAAVGTMLMMRTLQLLMMVYAYGGAFTLEHPAGDDHDHRKWSIWKSGMVRRLLRCKDFRRVRFLQGPLGQPFSKPTVFLSARLPLLERHLFSLYQPGWRPQVVLGGVLDGKWKTEASKVYPVRLCFIIAQQFLWYNSQAEETEREEEVSFIAPAVSALSSVWDGYGSEAMTMCNDFFDSTEVFT